MSKNTEVEENSQDLENAIAEIVNPINTEYIKIYWDLYNDHIDFRFKNKLTNDLIRRVTIGEKEEIHYINNSNSLTLETLISIEEEALICTKELYKRKNEFISLCRKRENLITKQNKIFKEKKQNA